ncbi:PASTA domain-containing protein [Actinocorallia libanotica]|uniref:PASTA domain-containing protein n=1 Tax=Actinocorallia libanotica TaxID=46162 RepID=A0ABN1RZI7_9ACTN
MRITPLVLLAALPLAACAAPAPNASPVETVTVTVTATPPANGQQKQQPADQPPAAKPAAKKVRLPKLVGLNGAIAQDKLEQLGLENVQFGSQDEEDKVVLLVTNWTVVKQSPKPGTRVGPKDLVVLTMTKEK